MLVKKVVFALPFLLLLLLSYQSLQSILAHPEVIFSLEVSSLLHTLTATFLLTAFMIFSLLFFTIFVTFAPKWEYITPAVLLAVSTPLVLFAPPISLILSLGSLIVLMVGAFLLKSELNSRLNFHPTILLSPITQTATLILLVFSLAYYQDSSNPAAAWKLEVPASLVNLSLKLAQPSASTPTPSQKTIPPATLEYLKQSPELLRQYVLDQPVLEQVTQAPAKSLNQQEIIRASLNKQLQSFISPYQKYIPAVASLVVFLTLEFFVYLLTIPLFLCLWFVFLILRVTHFAHYETEMREAKKLVV